MHWWSILFIPLSSAFIGLMANWITVRLLFSRILPRRQHDLARKLAQVVSNEISFNEIEQKITSPENLKKIMPVVETHIDEFLHKKLPVVFPMISMFIGEKTISQLKTVFMNELESIFPVLMQHYVQHLKQDFDPAQLVYNKVSTIDLRTWSSTVYRSKEFRFMLLLGAGIGLIFGIVQALLLYFLR